MKNFEKYEKEVKEIGLDFGIYDKLLFECFKDIDFDCDNCIFDSAICEKEKANWLYQEYKEPPILTDKEKAYLESFLKPFKDKIQCISKYHNSYTNEEYLMFCVVGDDDFNLPNFKKGTMYKGIELYKEYTLKELGLFEGIEK